MLKWIEAVNSAVNGFIWGVPAMVCIVVVGLYLSVHGPGRHGGHR